MRTCIAVLTVAAGAAVAEPDAAAKATLQAAADALKAATSLSYKVSAKGEGGILAGFSPKGTATVFMERNAENPKLWMSRIEGSSTAAIGGSEPMTFMVVSDGVKKAWKDEKQKMVVERMAGQAGGEQVGLADNMGAAEMLEPDPFAKDLAMATIIAEPAADVEGESCDVVKTDDGRQRPHRFFIAKSDHLPRRIEHRIEDGTMNDAQVWVIKDVKVNPPIPAGSFAISTPEGWTYSPATPPPPPPAPAAAANPVTSTDGSGVTTTLPGAPAAPAAPRQRAIGLNQQDLAPDFELTDSAGQKVRLSGLKESVVVMDFWGTWCLPCKQASPEVQKLVVDYKDKPVKVYGLAVREISDEKPAAYMKEGNYTYGLLLKADDVAKLFHVKVFPTYFVIGKGGEVVYSTSGYDPEKTFPAIRQAIDAALEGKAMPKTEEPKPEVKTEAKPDAKPGDVKRSVEPKPLPTKGKDSKGKGG
jgi:thiol-disulfide isomerase/thioredoxin